MKKNVESELRISEDFYPNGYESVGVYHFLEDGGVICAIQWGPTVKYEGIRIDINKLKFQWDINDPDKNGSLTISTEKIHIITGNGYSGSSNEQIVPEYKRKQLKEWIDKHYPLTK